MLRRTQSVLWTIQAIGEDSAGAAQQKLYLLILFLIKKACTQ